MRIWIQEVDDAQRDGLRAEAIQCDHTECFPEDPEEAARVAAELEANGLAYIGGGAAQLFVLTRADDTYDDRAWGPASCSVCRNDVDPSSLDDKGVCVDCR